MIWVTVKKWLILTVLQLQKILNLKKLILKSNKNEEKVKNNKKNLKLYYIIKMKDLQYKNKVYFLWMNWNKKQEVKKNQVFKYNLENNQYNKEIWI